MRQDVPLMLADLLPPLTSGFEVLVAEAVLKQRAAGELSTVRLLTLLVAFDPDEIGRRQARAIAANFLAARCTFFQPPLRSELADGLTEATSRQPLAQTCIVLALPEYDPAVELQLRTFLRTVRDSAHHDVPLVVGVATVPDDWVYAGLDGFVISEPVKRVPAALQVFTILTSLMAPGFLCALDADDIACGFGDASSPSRIVQALYRPDGRPSETATADDGMALHEASSVVAMPERSLRPLTLGKVTTSVHAIGNSMANYVMVTPFGLTLEPLSSGNCISVVLLCRPPQ
jgi:hypothetical protein